MSQETQAWAKTQKTGDPITKAVLLELCNWAKPTGVVEFLSLARIADTIEVSKRTVQRHLDKLEAPVEEGGLFLIRRVARHRDDGGQGANGFELIGYEPPAAGAKSSRVPVTPPLVNLSPPPSQIVTEGGDTVVTRLGDKITPLTIPDGIVPPVEKLDERIVHVNGRQPMSDETVRALNAVAAAVCADMADEPVKPHPLPADWTPPAIAELSDMARQLVEQWPAGAYQAVCEVFRLHWANETRAVGRKSNWNAALSKWLIKEHAQVTRDAKAGVSFARLSTARAGTAKGVRHVTDKARENETSAALHANVADRIGEAMHAQWIKPCALLLNPAVNELQIVAPSGFAANFIEEQYAADLRLACFEITKRTGVFKLQFVTERNAP